MGQPWVYICSPSWAPPPRSLPIPSLRVILVHHVLFFFFFVFFFLRKKDPHKISFCKDLRTIFIMLLWVSHQLNHDDVQHGRLSEGTWKQPGTPLLVHPSVISFAVVHCHSGAKSCPTLCDPMDCSTIKLTCLLKSYCNINIFLLRWIWVCISP